MLSKKIGPGFTVLIALSISLPNSALYAASSAVRLLPDGALKIEADTVYEAGYALAQAEAEARFCVVREKLIGGAAKRSLYFGGSEENITSDAYQLYHRSKVAHFVSSRACGDLGIERTR